MVKQIIATVSDNIIWNKDEFIVDLISEWQRGPVVIDFLNEGPCCQSLGLTGILDQIQSKFRLDPKDLIIHTSNQIPSSEYNEKRLPLVEMQRAKQFILASSNDTFDKKLGIFIGRSNANRLGLASYLDRHYRDSTLMTFHFDSHIDFHIANLGLENFLRYNWEHRWDTFNFLDRTPISNQKFNVYPIRWNKDAFDLEKQYQQIFCDIVCETFFSGKTFMPTEKTWRPIINRKPFLVQGPKWYLHNLRKMGFKTFNDWWSEDYDLVESDQKYAYLKEIIDYVSKQELHTLKQWYQEMQQVIEHNIYTLASLEHRHILQMHFYYE